MTKNEYIAAQAPIDLSALCAERGIVPREEDLADFRAALACGHHVRVLEVAERIGGATVRAILNTKISDYLAMDLEFL